MDRLSPMNNGDKWLELLNDIDVDELLEVSSPKEKPHVLVISHYKDDIVVITQDQGGVKVECNNNDII